MELRPMAYALAAAAALSTGAQALGQVAFNVIAEEEPYPWSLAPYDLSADGLVVVGQLSVHPQSMAFRWSADTGVILLDSTFENSVPVPLMMATSVSADGSVIAGITEDDHLFRWTADQGATMHPVFGDNWRVISAHMSDDGTVIVGDVAIVTIIFPYRWTLSGGAEVIANPGGTPHVTDVSGDGSTIVGYSECSPFAPWMWTEQGGSRALPTPEGIGRAYGVSFDGSVIVGQAGCPSCAHAVRWTAPLYEMEVLPEPTGGATESWAYGCSADGSTIVGWSQGTGRGQATVWRSGEPARLVADTLLTDFGVDVAPRVLAPANYVSADGRVIVGDSRGADGLLDPWIVRFDPSANCPCDFDQTSPAVDNRDLLAYLDAWFAKESRADLDTDAAVDINDLLTFLDCWFHVTAAAPC